MIIRSSQRSKCLQAETVTFGLWGIIMRDLALGVKRDKKTTNKITKNILNGEAGKTFEKSAAKPLSAIKRNQAKPNKKDFLTLTIKFGLIKSEIVKK